jgi:Transmembrane secretion effector
MRTFVSDQGADFSSLVIGTGPDFTVVTALELPPGSRVVFATGSAVGAGATSWRAWQDSSDPSRILEQFVVASFDEHLRQHERVTRRDQDQLDRIRQMTDPGRPVVVTHWLVANPVKASPAT